MVRYKSFLGYILYIWLIMENFVSGVYSLKNMHMTVPEAVKLGDTITLACDYDLESVALYTIKWYRNEEEFYRYVPKESPPSRVFIMPHLDVDISRSNSRKVTLRDVERETAGTFKCEVSADAPLFHTDMRSAELIVAEIPDEEPVLRTDVHKITPGARISANCTTPGSFPFMNVTWHVNDEEIQSKLGVYVQNSIVFYDALPGLETVRSSIAINSTQDYFKKGKMKISCTATMFNLYNETKEVEIMEDTPQLAPIREHSTHSGDAVFSINCSCLNGSMMGVILISILLSHLWMRRLLNTS